LRSRTAARGILFVLAILAAPLAVGAQPAGKVWRIGILADAPSADPRAPIFWTPLVEGLREFGYVEGQNIATEARYTEGNFDQLRDFAIELVRLRVDLIVAVTTIAAQAAKAATSTVPIVFTNVADPIAPGLVTSLAPSGGNITGLSSMVAELSGKRLELLKEALPRVSRVGVIWLRQSSPVSFGQAKAAGVRLGFQIQSLEVVGLADVQRAFEAAARERAGAVLVVDNPGFSPAVRAQILDFAMKRRLPVISQYKHFAEAGALMSYGIDLRDHCPAVPLAFSYLSRQYDFRAVRLTSGALRGLASSRPEPHVLLAQTSVEVSHGRV